MSIAPRSILIIDADPDRRAELGRRLRQGPHPYQIAEAETWSGGLALSRGTPPDCVLLGPTTAADGTETSPYPLVRVAVEARGDAQDPAWLSAAIERAIERHALAGPAPADEPWLQDLRDLDRRAEDLPERDILELGLAIAARATGSAVGYARLGGGDHETIALYPQDSGTDPAWNPTTPPHQLEAPVIEDGQTRLLLRVGHKPDDYDEADQTRLRRLGDELQAILRRRQALDRLARARAAAEADSQAKSALLAQAGQEIQAPLNSLLGWVERLRREGVAERQAEPLDRIEALARHALRLAGDWLGLAAIEAEGTAPVAAPFNLSELIRATLDGLGTRAQAKGLSLRVNLAQVPRQLEGDAPRLGQALTHYLDNAIESTERGHVTLSARMAGETAGDCLIRFEVADSGPATPHERRLAIARRLAERMGGGAGSGSAPDGGNLFWFTARLRKGHPAPPQAAVPPEARLRRDHRGTRILLVEDDIISQEVALMLLEETGLSADLAANGREALRLLAQGGYALILMDMQMPEMDGLETTRHIRRQPGFQDVPIVALTANAFQEDRSACFAAGMDDFIAKPVDPGMLFATLLKWLERGHKSPPPAP
ncbi:response regulator [Methylomagnum ishizawai]|uniref:response regulator n=1 Tax=Methylomagnum ishizawai TaxID=1760988 RepID=UPI001C3327E2|nr:hybrid sensor histidine kinase/response regulator [Methylomagnum ishizawai]BBL75811.1 hypothetical protein MishRS11D_29090 [Methylomagnum ishizawai]